MISPSGGRSLQKRNGEIEELRRKLEQLQREYEEVTNMKTSLEKEINTYRELLEGTNNREGLKQIVDHVLEDARRMELERLSTGSNVAGSLSYSGTGNANSGRPASISRTFIASTGTGMTNPGINSLIQGASRISGQASYSQTSTRREYTSSN